MPSIGFGQHVKVLTGQKGHVRISHRTQFTRPQTGTQSDRITRDLTAGCFQTEHPSVARLDPGHTRVLEQPRTPAPSRPLSALRKRPRVKRRPSSGDQTAPRTSSAFIKGQRSLASADVTDSADTP